MNTWAVVNQATGPGLVTMSTQTSKHSPGSYATCSASEQPNSLIDAKCLAQSVLHTKTIRRVLSDSYPGPLPCSADLCILCKYRETMHKRIPTVAVQP